MNRISALLCGLLLGGCLIGCADPAPTVDPQPACATASAVVVAPAANRPSTTGGVVWQLRDLDPRAGNATPGAALTAVRRAPYRVAGLSDVIDVASTATTFFAVKADGTVWVWGQDGFGLFGRGTERGYSYTPVQVSGVSDARALDVVGYTVFVRRADGSVVGWGAGGAGLLREGRTGWSPEGQPAGTSIGLPASISRIGGSYDTALAVTADGQVWAWGANLTQIVNPDGRTGLSRIAGLQGVRAVTGTLDSAFALRADGAVCAWGANIHGEFGDGTTSGNLTSRPLRVPGLPPVVAIAGGDRTVYALDPTGRVWAWGDGGSGGLGDGNIGNHLRPKAAEIQGLPRIAAISATGFTAFAVSTDGRLFGWGSTFGLPAGTAPSGADSVPRALQIPVPAAVRMVSGYLALAKS